MTAWPLPLVRLGLLVVLALSGWVWVRGGERHATAAARTLLFLFVAGLVLAIPVLVANLTDPHAWDFLAFYLAGQGAAEGYDVYRSEGITAALARTSVPLAVPDSFREEFLPSGFLYPPPTVAAVRVLLGEVGYRTGQVLWMAMNLSALAVALLVLAKDIGRDHGRRALLALAALALLLPATERALHHEQITLVAFLAVVMAWKDRDRARAGAWIVLGAVAKPFIAALMLYVILRRNWRALAVAGATTVVVLLVTWAVLGPDPFVTYFTDNPGNRAPTSLQTQLTNGSMLSTMLRFLGVESVGTGAFAFPPYVAAVLILAVGTVWGSLRDRRGDLAFLLCLTFAFLVYPSGLAHYAVVLVLPVAWWARRLALDVRDGPVTAGMVAALGLAVFCYAMGRFFFAANLVLWCAFLAVAVRGPQTAPAARAPLPRPRSRPAPRRRPDSRRPRPFGAA